MLDGQSPTVGPAPDRGGIAAKGGINAAHCLRDRSDSDIVRARRRSGSLLAGSGIGSTGDDGRGGRAGVECEVGACGFAILEGVLCDRTRRREG
jgi:hypothetical protein